ncbi:MAG: PspC domain-containing protein [Flavobacteriia bacterium]|nr:PspC domain-containing protein [Flavobacteriia bacterium]NBX37976.1 PspC domain-containing protein [Flavobacteriia bacterium]
MRRLLQKTIFFFELQSYGVCLWLARKLGIHPYKVRLGFIYFSFIGLGSPVVLYLIMAWILEHQHYFQRKSQPKKSVWEL